MSFFAVSRRKGLIFVSKEFAQASRSTSSVWWCLTTSLNYLSRIAIAFLLTLQFETFWMTGTGWSTHGTTAPR